MDVLYLPNNSGLIIVPNAPPREVIHLTLYTTEAPFLVNLEKKYITYYANNQEKTHYYTQYYRE